MGVSPSDPTAAVTQDEGMTMGNNSANMFPQIDASSVVPANVNTGGQNFLNEDFL